MENEKEAGFINSAIDFFANIGTGEKLEVDNDSGIYSPAAMHEVNPKMLKSQLLFHSQLHIIFLILLI